MPVATENPMKRLIKIRGYPESKIDWYILIKLMTEVAMKDGVISKTGYKYISISEIRETKGYKETMGHVTISSQFFPEIVEFINEKLKEE